MSGISILMYHQVGRFAPMKAHRAGYCDVGRFRDQMRALKWLGIPVWRMDQAVAALRGETAMPQRAVVLSFDDGYDNFYEQAVPVLQELGYPAISYAVAGRLGAQADWLSGHGLARAPRLMDAARLRELIRLGHEVGSHALSHLRLAELPPETQAEELRRSRELLQQALGQAVPHVCYPYGSHNLHTLQQAAEAGYESGVTCQRAAAHPGFDILALPRKAISYGDTLPGFLWKLYMKDEPKGQSLRRPRT